MTLSVDNFIPSMSPSKAEVLYYPSIEFQSEDWVKRVLLYWDRVIRIVPEGYEPNDSDFVRSLFDEGLIRNITVRQPQLEEAALRFKELLESSPASGFYYDPKNDTDTYLRIHHDKVYAKLWEAFRSAEITRINGEWLHLPRHMALYYMMTLANTVAAKRNVPTGTDNMLCWCINPVFKEKGRFNEIVLDEKNRGLYCQLMLEDVFPESVEGITSNDLITFARNRQTEKWMLRSRVESIINRLYSVTDPEQIDTELNDFIDEIEKAKNEYIKAGKFIHSVMPTTALVTGVPIAFTTYSAINGQANPIMAGVSSLLLAAYATITNYSEIKKRRNKSYQSYLVGIDKAASKTLCAYSANDFDEFVND